MRVRGLVVAIGLAFAAPVFGQTHPHPDGSAVPAPAGLRAGDIAFANSGSKAAQPSFLEGLALLHDFEYQRAAEAFRRAEAADPGFAMAYWGEAMTYNHGIWMEQDLPAARAALAKLGPTLEARRAKAATAREREYLSAVEILYGDGTKEARDFRYANAMEVLHAKYPGDVDATAFYALSLLGTCHEGRDFATYMKAAALLEEVYPTHLRHPGVLHYLIHSYDDPIHAPLGLRAAERYGAVAPDAPHALHMTSHIFLALGMWDEVIAANVKAIRVGNEFATQHKHPVGGCGHYEIWLMYAELQERRDADALAGLTACRHSAAAALTAQKPATYDPDNSAVSSYVFMRLLQVVETGHREPMKRLAWSGPGYAAPDFFDAYGDAVAALRAKNLPRLQSAVAKLVERRPPLLAQLVADGDTARADRENVDVIVDQMAAVARIRAGDSKGGLIALRKAADLESAMPMQFGPPMVALPSWEQLGKELLRAQRPADATQAFRNALARAPGRTQSLEGLLKSEELSGDAEAAASTRLDLARYPRGSH
jgi:tetratricopeptide (TPR) repeat protein